MKKWILPVAAVTLAAAAWAGFTSTDSGPVTPVKTRAASTQVANPQRAVRTMLRAAGDAFTLPVELTPDATQFSSLTVVDANGDDVTWTLDSGFLKYKYHDTNDADDWVYIPIQLGEADRLLEVSFQARAESSWDTEALDVAFGREMNGSAMTVFRHVETKNTSWLNGSTYTDEVETDGAGIAYIGFHAVSEKYCSGIRLRNIIVRSKRVLKPQPAVLVTSSIDGLLYNATVQMPDKTILDEEIGGNLGLKVAVDGKEIKDITPCTPGQQVDVELSLRAGAHVVSFIPYVNDGADIHSAQAIEDAVEAVKTGDYTLPFFFAPTEEDFDECTVINANNDGQCTWSYSNDGFQYFYNDYMDADDWVILPVIDFGADNGSFEINMDVKGMGSYYTETFEVCLGRTAEIADMTVKFAPEAVKTDKWDTRSGKFSLAEGGKWYVALHATSPKAQWNLYVKNIAISRSADLTPAAPVVKSMDFNGLEGNVTVTLPAVTVDNQPIEGQVGAVVSVDGVEVATSAMAAAGEDVTVPVTLTLGKHSVGVAAFVENNGSRLVSAQVLREVIGRNPEGYAYTIPFTMHPTLGEFETLTVTDANADGFTWDYNAGAANGTGAAVCRTNGEETADDWLIFPAVAVTDISRIYNISVEARAYLEQYPEDFDLCIGTAATPAAMTPVVEARGYKTYLYAPVSGEWIAPAAGNYYVGIHRISAGSAHTLSIMDVKIEDAGKSVLAPAACTGFDAAGDASGALTANVEITLPLKAIDGSDLDASAMLTVTVTSATGATATATGLPGATVNLSVAAPEGHSKLTAVASSDLYGAGEVVETTVYCGLDRPSIPVVTAAVTEDNMGLTLTWTDPARGEQGGAINTDQLSHTIYTPVDAQGLYWNKIVELPVGQNSYTFDAELLQDITFVGVSATNAKGESQLGVGYGVTGTPYSLPMTEDLANGAYSYSPVVIDTPTDEYSVNWFLDNPSLIYPDLGDDAPKALMCIEASDPVSRLGRVSLPKFSTVGAHNPQLTMTVYAAPQAAKATVYAVSFGAEDVKVGEIPAGGQAGWTDYTFPLPASLVGKAWVNLYIETEFTAAPQAFVLGSYSLKSTYDNQLSTRLQAAAEMAVGQTYTLKATVKNSSLTAKNIPAAKFEVVYGDVTETILAVAASGDMVEPDAEAQLTAEFTPVAEMIGDARVLFTLYGYTDEVPEDNSDYADVTITNGGLPVVTDLSGTHSDEGLVLTWTAPETGSTGNEDFESYEAFSYAEAMGPWLNVDVDGKVPYAIAEDLVFPGCDAPRAFQVIDAGDNGIDLDLKAYSGDKYLMAVCPDDGSAADDWLISPLVAGGSKVSFRFNVLSSLYGTEQVDLMYSTTGREPADFTLLQTYSQNMRGWNPLEATLPADARYFAFHYRSKDIFGIALDDVFYTPLGEAPVAGYHVYHNGVKVASSHPETSYSVGEWRQGDRFNVSAVANVGGAEMEHPLSNTFVATTSALGSVESFGSVRGVTGAVLIEGMAGESASVYTPEGKLAAAVASLSKAEKIMLQPGIYIVRLSGGAVVKVRVS